MPAAVANMEALLAKAREQDERVAAVAATAQPAGDADPYKHDDEDPNDESAGDAR